MTTFGARLRNAMIERGSLCVGIDPHAALLRDWDLPDDAAGLERFSRTVVEALAGEVAVLKPQSAFFERHGSRGIAVLEQVVATARAAGALVLMDAKRGDIGSTMQAYADAYVDPSSPLCSDAVTASPYLGFGSLRPLIDTALTHGNGVFVLALTSNPDGGEVQSAKAVSGRTVAATILEHVRAANRGSIPWGSVGCVVGATIGTAGAAAAGSDAAAPDSAFDIGGPLLAPGLGAQGGTVQDLRDVFGSALPSVLPSVSRSVLRAGPNPSALRAAVSAHLDEIRDLRFQRSAEW